MRMHPLCLLLVVVAPALVAAQNHCIVGCNCTNSAETVTIAHCDSPLVLTKQALFNVSTKITNLQLKNVIVTQIEKQAFEGFDELERVIVEDSLIGSIDSSAFDLPELGTINFMRTTFREIPTLVSEYLEELIFDDCKLSKVPNLKQLPALEFLNLANNNIKDIDQSTFDNVPSLEELNLSNNSVSELPPDLFDTNPDFNNLNLDHNPLKRFHLNFIPALELLSLRNCQLTNFDRNVTKNLNSLGTLFLSGNQISVLPLDVFESMKDLNNIDLSNNKLVELDDDIFSENSQLDRIVLDNNPFETLPKFQANGKPFQTYTFSCKNCSLKSVTGVFDNMKHLVSIDLSHNRIQNVEGVFAELQDLKKLYLSNNEIQQIGVEAFGKNSTLETLDLSNNPLEPLDPVVFATISALKELNISNCNLKLLWANHNAVLASLENLFAGRNQLNIVTIDDVKIMPLLKQIDLEENPLSCVQDLQTLIDYLVDKVIYPKDAGDILKTHENLENPTTYNPKKSWSDKLLPPNCVLDVAEDQDSLYENDIEDDENYDLEYGMSDKADIAIEESVQDPNSFNLAKASYILSITSVFILTALLVLFIAVVIILFIMKRNKSFNMHNGNLPRLKIPLWHTTPGLKKHSGSVYKPLSEELSGSRTPIINRYEFKQTPQVHNSIP